MCVRMSIKIDLVTRNHFLKFTIYMIHHTVPKNILREYPFSHIFKIAMAGLKPEACATK